MVSFASLTKFTDVIDQFSQSTGLVSLDLTMVNLVVDVAWEILDNSFQFNSSEPPVTIIWCFFTAFALLPKKFNVKVYFYFVFLILINGEEFIQGCRTAAIIENNVAQWGRPSRILCFLFLPFFIFGWIAFLRMLFFAFIGQVI